MIVIPIAGASLRPLSLIIFPAKFLTDRRIGHIEKGDKKTAEMSEVGDAASRSFDRGKEFNQAEDDDKVFSRNGEQKIDVDQPVGKEPTKGEKESVDGSGGPDDGDALINFRSKENGTDTRTDAAEQKKSQKLLRSPVVFQFSAEHPEGQEVKQEMEDPSVEKDVRTQLPHEVLPPDQNGDECKVVKKIVEVGLNIAEFNYLLKEEDGYHDHDQILNHRCQAISEGKAVAVIGHFSSPPRYGKILPCPALNSKSEYSLPLFIPSPTGGCVKIMKPDGLSP